MHPFFTLFNQTRPAGWVANPAAGPRAGKLTSICIGLIYLLLMGLTAQAQNVAFRLEGTAQVIPTIRDVIAALDNYVPDYLFPPVK